MCDWMKVPFFVSAKSKEYQKNIDQGWPEDKILPGLENWKIQKSIKIVENLKNEPKLYMANNKFHWPSRNFEYPI